MPLAAKPPTSQAPRPHPAEEIARTGEQVRGALGQLLAITPGPAALVAGPTRSRAVAAGLTASLPGTPIGPNLGGELIRIAGASGITPEESKNLRGLLELSVGPVMAEAMIGRAITLLGESIGRAGLMSRAVQTGQEMKRKAPRDIPVLEDALKKADQLVVRLSAEVRGMKGLRGLKKAEELTMARFARDNLAEDLARSYTAQKYVPTLTHRALGALPQGAGEVLQTLGSQLARPTISRTISGRPIVETAKASKTFMTFRVGQDSESDE